MVDRIQPDRIHDIYRPYDQLHFWQKYTTHYRANNNYIEQFFQRDCFVLPRHEHGRKN